MSRAVAAGCVAGLVTASAAAAQSPARDSTTLLLLEWRATASSPDTGVLLDPHKAYNVVLAGTSADVHLRVFAGDREAFLSPLPRVPGADLIIEIYPRTTAVHSFHLDGLAVGDTVMLRLYTDPNRTAEAVTRQRKTWAIGIHVGASVHSDYALSTSSHAADGSGLEAGLLLTTASGWWSLGIVAGQDFAADTTITTAWFFVEPRVRLWRPPGPLEVGALLRFGLGDLTAERGVPQVTPFLNAAGLDVSMVLQRSPARDHLIAHVALTRAIIGQVRSQTSRLNRATFALEWVP